MKMIFKKLEDFKLKNTSRVVEPSFSFYKKKPLTLCGRLFRKFETFIR